MSEEGSQKMWKKLGIQRGDSSNNEVKDYAQKIDNKINENDQGSIEECNQMNIDEFEEQMRNQVEFSPLNKSEQAMDDEFHQKEIDTSFDLKKEIGKYQINANNEKISKFEMPNETLEQEEKPIILEQSDKIKDSDKYSNLKYLVEQIKLEQESIISYLKRKFQQFSFQISKNMKQNEIVINDFMLLLINKKDSEVLTLKERIKKQQTTIEDLKSISQQRSNSFLENQLLQEKLVTSQNQLEKANMRIKELENTVNKLETQNDQLQQAKFDFEQKMEQFDLQVERKIEEKQYKENRKSFDQKQQYLNRIRCLQEQLQNFSQKCLQSSSRQAKIHEREQCSKERQNQLLVRQNHLDQQYGELQSKQIDLQRISERLRIKEAQLNLLEENLYKKIEQVQLRENQLYSRKAQIKRMEGHNFRSDKKEDEKQEFQLHGKCFSKQYKGSQAYSRPVSSMKNRERPFTNQVSRATHDIDVLSNKSGSKAKDNYVRSKMGLQTSGRGNHRSPGDGNKLNNLSSKLERLRNQIRKQIQAVK